MSALLTARPPSARQERLFGDDPPVSVASAPAVPAAPPRRDERPPAATGATVVDSPRPASGPTLSAAVTSLWDRLAAAQSAACPICDAPMEPVRSAPAGVIGGRCRSCGSTLS
jgi:hypothetical protein